MRGARENCNMIRYTVDVRKSNYFLKTAAHILERGDGFILTHRVAEQAQGIQAKKVAF